MRNIFDQYSQPENRITHALLTVVNEDRKLLDAFLRELVKVIPPTDAAKLSISEQQFPGEEEPIIDETERRGIPDGWIFDDEGWCVFIETKVLATLTADQLIRHYRSAARRGFDTVIGVAIAPRPLLPTSAPAHIKLLEWRDIYAWLKRHSSVSMWAARAVEYLEIIETKLINSQQLVEGTLTMFSGFPFGFDRPYTYFEAKRVLVLALRELRGRKNLLDALGVNKSAPGRPAITGRHGDGIWDFLSLAPELGNFNFTKYPHLSLVINSQAVEAPITVPHAVNTTMRKNLIRLGEVGFRGIIENIVNNLNPLLLKHTGATPWFRGIQRRYPSQRATPLVDAIIEFDLRTAIPGGSPPKAQPRWLSAAYGSFVNKENANYQISIGVRFPYDRCPELRKPEAIDLIASAWLSCKPLVDLARTEHPLTTSATEAA